MSRAFSALYVDLSIRDENNADLHQQAFYCQFMNRFHSGYRLVGTAMRVCTSLGLHRPVAESQSLEREHCLRLWWTVYVLDRFWGQRLGSPAQIDDKDIHLDLPSESVSKMHHEQFGDTTYQFSTIGLAKICGNTIKEIYSRPHSPTSFLQHEQKILLQLRHWARSLPESMKLQQGKSNPTHLVQKHLQFNFVGFFMVLNKSVMRTWN